MTKVMRHSEGQKQLFSGLKQIFSDKERNEDGFERIEKVLEGLVTADNENKKSVLDQVSCSMIMNIIVLIVMCVPGVPRVRHQGAVSGSDSKHRVMSSICGPVRHTGSQEGILFSRNCYPGFVRYV